MNTHIKSISFIGGKMDGQTLVFHPNMNTLIGIRGAGKSSILETLRYALDIPLGKEARDMKYKEHLVYEMLGSGGKIVVTLVDQHGQEYVVERIYGDPYRVYRDGMHVPNLRIAESVVNALYFGQKDLSEIGADGFGKDLIEKFFGQKTGDIRQQIAETEANIRETVRQMQQIKVRLQQQDDYLAQQAELEEKLRLFREYKIDEKLQKQVDFNRDFANLREIIDFENTLLESLTKICEASQSGFDRLLAYQAVEETQAFERIHQAFYDQCRSLCLMIRQSYEYVAELKAIDTQFAEKGDALHEEFAKIKRKINVPSLNPDDFVRFSTLLDEMKHQLATCQSDAAELATRTKQLLSLLETLDRLRHQEFLLLAEEVQALNERKLSIAIVLGYKDDKEQFYRFLEDLLAGCNIQKANLRKVINAYGDPLEIYSDLYVLASPLHDILSGGGQLPCFQERIEISLAEFLTYQVPNTYTLFYKGKELQGHSLGQRASALIMFILTKGDHDVIMIDQPEDDLDNQTIYEDVVRELVKLKGQTQFLFASHNPNIPVLGDCENVIRCEYMEETIQVLTGSVTEKPIRHEIINIMEGGQEAFDRRKKAYRSWGW